MAALLLLLGLQASSFEDAVAAFAKGDDAARAELLKSGACSIRPLRKLRATSPERIDALLWDLKIAVAGFDTKPLVKELESRRSIDLADADLVLVHADLVDGLPLQFDQTLRDLPRKATLKFEVRPQREILESLCRQLELDYGFFYGIVFIAAPERLWPEGPPPRLSPLSADEVKRAQVLIDRLNSDRVDERDDAMAALVKFGEAVIPVLEKTSVPTDVEAAARRRDLIARVKRPPPSGVFHPPAAQRQTLMGKDLAVLTQLGEGQVSFKVADIVLNGAMMLFLQPRQIPYRLAPTLKEKRATIDLQNVSGLALLSIVLHSAGYDFLIEDGAVVIDRREEIERRVEAGR